MDCLISFLEGIITFISPCILPMLPIYISYFAGQTEVEQGRPAIRNAAGFVLGFSFVFVMLGAFAGTIGSTLKEYNTVVNIIAGMIVIIFGLNFMDMIKLPFLNSHRQFSSKNDKVGFLSSVTFGVIFFNQLDALCRGIFRICTHACRIHRRQHPWNSDAFQFFAWTWHTIPCKCRFN